MNRATSVVMAAALAACGFSSDSGPRPIDLDQVPEASTTVAAAAGPEVELWFVDGAALVPLRAVVRDRAPGTVVEALIGRGVDFGEGLRSAIPPATVVLGAVIEDGVATVDLSSAFTLVGGGEEILAVGQIVLTLASLEGVEGVRLLIDGTPVNAPVGEGELVDRPLTSEDFTVVRGG